MTASYAGEGDTVSGIITNVLSWALIQEARRRAGFSQRELADRAGTSQAAIARIERGRQVPSLETLDRILRACDLELRLELVPRDRHDEGLIEATLAMTPEQRVRGVEEASRLAAGARAA
jgi:transcriptional regulator with XRE-family HTH domain